LHNWPSSENTAYGGQIHNYLDEWKFILEKDINDDKSCVLDWLEHGVDVNKFFRHFKGNFKGRHFDSNIPSRSARHDRDVV
jgi:hypothetical protein